MMSMAEEPSERDVCFDNELAIVVKNGPGTLTISRHSSFALVQGRDKPQRSAIAKTEVIAQMTSTIPNMRITIRCNLLTTRRLIKTRAEPFDTAIVET
jgi:hypothetical protein